MLELPLREDFMAADQMSEVETASLIAEIRAFESRNPTQRGFVTHTTKKICPAPCGIPPWEVCTTCPVAQ